MSEDGCLSAPVGGHDFSFQRLLPNTLFVRDQQIAGFPFRRCSGRSSSVELWTAGAGGRISPSWWTLPPLPENKGRRLARLGPGATLGERSSSLRTGFRAGIRRKNAKRGTA